MSILNRVVDEHFLIHRRKSTSTQKPTADFTDYADFPRSFRECLATAWAAGTSSGSFDSGVRPRSDVMKTVVPPRVYSCSKHKP